MGKKKTQTKFQSTWSRSFFIWRAPDERRKHLILRLLFHFMDTCCLCNEKWNYVCVCVCVFPPSIYWAECSKHKNLTGGGDRRGQVKWGCTKKLGKWQESEGKKKTQRWKEIILSESAFICLPVAERFYCLHRHFATLSLSTPFFFLFFSFSPPVLPRPPPLKGQSDSHLFHIRPTLWLRSLCIHAGRSA